MICARDMVCLGGMPTLTKMIRMDKNYEELRDAVQLSASCV